MFLNRREIRLYSRRLVPFRLIAHEPCPTTATRDPEPLYHRYRLLSRKYSSTSRDTRNRIG
jgi:hypothetical protein